MRPSAYALLTALSFAACAHNQATEPQPGASAPVASSEKSDKKAEEAPPAIAASSPCKSDEACQNGQLCLNNGCVEASAELCSKSRVQSCPQWPQFDTF